jgi:hypothetical protein
MNGPLKTSLEVGIAFCFWPKNEQITSIRNGLKPAVSTPDNKQKTGLTLVTNFKKSVATYVVLGLNGWMEK